MESKQIDSSSSPTGGAPDIGHSVTQQGAPLRDTPSIFSASGISTWARSLKNVQQLEKEDTQPGNAVMTTFARLTSGIGSRLSGKLPVQDESADGNSTAAQAGVLGSITKGLVDTSLNAVKAVQVKARHAVSQNKRRYQEGGFDLDMTYITDNILAMGFPAGDMSSGLLGYVEGFYRNHMEEVIKFFETHHKGKYKVYNLCSERLYNASLFQGKVAAFPFDNHNCPPIQLILSFCQSASSWLKEDGEHVIAVHCKAGMGRTGLMISSLMLFLKLFPTTEASIDHYNQTRCLDGKGLVLPSQIRYVRYFERILTDFNSEIPPGRRCMLRGFRLHKCPYWIRPSVTICNHTGVLFSTKRHPKTKDLQPQDFWFSSKKKGIMVFALPGEPGLTELSGDFKIHFHDGQGDFYCWLNTAMMENRVTLNSSELDDFDKRKIPSPGFELEIVMIDHDGSHPQRSATANEESDRSSVNTTDPRDTGRPSNKPTKGTEIHDKDDVFSDSESEENSRHASVACNTEIAATTEGPESKSSHEETTSIRHGIEQVSLKDEDVTEVCKSGELKRGDTQSSLQLEASKLGLKGVSEFKPIAADASVFSFGDEDEYDSD